MQFAKPDDSAGPTNFFNKIWEACLASRTTSWSYGGSLTCACSCLHCMPCHTIDRINQRSSFESASVRAPNPPLFRCLCILLLVRKGSVESLGNIRQRLNAAEGGESANVLSCKSQLVTCPRHLKIIRKRLTCVVRTFSDCRVWLNT